MAEYPPNKLDWEQRAAFLIRDFDGTRNKMAKDNLRKLLDFANGDSTGDIITHFCLLSENGVPCCQSEQESLCKFLTVAVPFFCKGFSTPLLYRMKHYKPASSYIKVGCMFFHILPRVLAAMQSNTQPDTDLSRCVDIFMKESASHTPSAQEDFEHLLADALDADRDYAAQNGLRRRMVSQQISRPGFHQAAMLIDALIEPLERGINFLLGHTKTLMDLKMLGRNHKEASELQANSRAGFLHLVKGNLADTLLKGYGAFLDNGLQELISMGLDPTPERLNMIFTSVIVLCTDLHRRLKHDFSGAPFQLFAMIGMDTDSFVEAWGMLERQLEKCESCLDQEFTVALVKQFRGVASKPRAEQDAIRIEVQGLLEDIATWSATTSDLVELKNGQVQFSVSRRGSQNVKGPYVAAEISLLQAAVLQHEWIKSAVEGETLPKKSTRSGVASMSGVKTIRGQDRGRAW